MTKRSILRFLPILGVILQAGCVHPDSIADRPEAAEYIGRVYELQHDAFLVKNRPLRHYELILEGKTPDGIIPTFSEFSAGNWQRPYSQNSEYIAILRAGELIVINDVHLVKSFDCGRYYTYYAEFADSTLKDRFDPIFLGSYNLNIPGKDLLLKLRESK